MRLIDAHMRNFDMLTKAFGFGTVCIAACKEIATDKTVAIICAVNQHGEEFELVPYAKMLEGDPYTQYEPPGLDDKEKVAKANIEDEAPVWQSELEEWVATTFAGRNDEIGYQAAALLYSTSKPSTNAISIGVRGRALGNSDVQEVTLNVRREALKRDHTNLPWFLNEFTRGVLVTHNTEGDILVEILERPFSEEELADLLRRVARRAVWYVTTETQNHRRRT